MEFTIKGYYPYEKLVIPDNSLPTSLLLLCFKSNKFSCFINDLDMNEFLNSIVQLLFFILTLPQKISSEFKSPNKKNNCFSDNHIYTMNLLMNIELNRFRK